MGAHAGHSSADGVPVPPPSPSDWTCQNCGAVHQRDDNASINLARYEQASVVGPVRAAVKRGADHKTGPRPAGGHEARKGRRHKPAEQPRDGVPGREH
ncbi:MAG: zinc ribbon domain-containing protein [Actinomycetota bacterium]|nr:zinc ribbon domain-containing protein [Actinomycetota bacterium]